MCIEPNGDGTYILKCPDGTTVHGSYESVRHIADLIIGAAMKHESEKENPKTLSNFYEDNMIEAMLDYEDGPYIY